MKTTVWVWAARYAVAVLVLIALATWLLRLHYGAASDRHAILVAAATAAPLQILTFVLARRMARTNPVAGWGIGAACCLAGLFVFGLTVEHLALPLEPALIGFATFLFITEFVEPLFLRP